CAFISHSGCEVGRKKVMAKGLAKTAESHPPPRLPSLHVQKGIARKKHLAKVGPNLFLGFFGVMCHLRFQKFCRRRQLCITGRAAQRELKSQHASVTSAGASLLNQTMR